MTFSKEGAGCIVIEFCDISGNWEIRSVLFGLPAERPEAMKRISEIVETIMNEMEPFIDEDENAKESIWLQGKRLHY